MTDCGAETFLIALLLAVAPVVTGFLGFNLNHRLESKRQESQWAHDHNERRRHTTRDTLVSLQRALAGVRGGSETAAMLLYADQSSGIDAARAATAEPWWKDWAAAREVSILTAQLSNQELIDLAHAVGVELQHVVESSGDPARLRAAIDRIHETYERANELAGRLIQELDAAAPVTTHR